MVFELVYTSFLSPDFDIRSVADIVRRARSFNREHGLTSLLVFDGERFCQHIEGDREAVLQLAARIAADKRHQRVTILHQDFAGQTRRFSDWPLAYALDSRGDAMESLCRARGPEVVARLQRQISALVFLP